MNIVCDSIERTILEETIARIVQREQNATITYSTRLLLSEEAINRSCAIKSRHEKGERDANPSCEITEYGSHCPAREQCRDAAGASERSASSVMYHTTLRACPIKLDVASARYAVSPCPCTYVHVHMCACVCVCVCLLDASSREY